MPSSMGSAAHGSPPYTPAVEFIGVSKRYSDLTVLDDLTFSVNAGEHLALIGPSGSGKTTILRILMTLETISSGRAVVNGDCLSHQVIRGEVRPPSEAYLRKIRSKIGMVFQHFNLFPHKTALENICLAPMLTRGRSKTDAERSGRALLEQVGLADKANEYPDRLSGGQKQRVAIARALALEPQIMLFDEITSALDPELVEEVLNVIQRLRRETSMTMLLVTHEMSFAKDFADRVLFFDRGKLVEEGKPSQIFSSPKVDRTQVFLRKILAAGQRI